ncbi:hypothetical protein C8E01_104352 [Pontibacter virosus]|uniref:Uncharacterized protein n=1 Tax=Pontibacter virosus TaxID=1765052 RepID=A0A2U1AZW3_9BACT|nr:hypothetical protein C8E01_104352 [Pontibacter virosus]
MKKQYYIFPIFIILCLYYFLDYKRSFVHNKDKTEYITIWRKLGGQTYIIPGKYYSILPPSANYIKTLSSAKLYVIWNTSDENRDIALYVYSSFIQLNDLDGRVMLVNSYKDFFYRYGEFNKSTKSNIINTKYDFDLIDIGCLNVLFTLLPCPSN